VVEAAAERTHDVAVGLAVGVRCAVVELRRADLRQRRRRLEPRAGQLQRRQRNRLFDVAGAESELRADALRGRGDLGRRRLLVLVAPAPVLAAALRGLYQ
jgi:hypothetical protein